MGENVLTYISIYLNIIYKRNRMTSGEENRQRNRNREGEESECMFVCLYVWQERRRSGEEGYIGQI